MKLTWILVLSVFLAGCFFGKKNAIQRESTKKKSISKILKNPDPDYKLRIAEQYFAAKKYAKAQVIYEDVMPFKKTDRVFEDIYYKYAYCAYYLKDYMNAENLFKSFLEIFPNSAKAEEVDYMRAYSFFKQSPKPELDQTNTIRTIGLMQTFINTHPGSPRIKEANDIIDICRQKLEIKDRKAALLYYDLQQYRAAGVAYTELLNAYPESELADEYKLMIIKSYYRFAELSVEDRQPERFERVITEYNEFVDRFPDSKHRKEAEEFLNLSQRNIKRLNTLTNEQTKTPA